MKQRVFGLLNIKVSESKYVFDLLSIQLFIGIANSFINIVSFTFFIHHFAITSISYAYLIIAAFLLLLNVGYEKLERKLSPLHLLRTVIAISAVILLLQWAGLLVWDKSVMIFSLLVWGTLFYMVTGYAYWGLVSLLFNIRESKRVFSIVGSGDIPAKLIGYLSAPLLIPVIGINNLLLLSVVSLGIGFVLLTRLIHRKRWEKVGRWAHLHVHNTKHTVANDSLVGFFLKNKLIFFISLLSLLSYNVFNLVDYTFVTQIKAKVQNLSTLATYIAVFFAVGRVITLILKLVFTSRMIERLGIIRCLMITPVTLFIFCVLFVLFDHSSYTLYEFGAMAMLTEVLRSAMQEPVFFILFQPLNEHNRLKGHIIAKGYMLAPSLLIVGASLLIAEKVGVELTIPLTIKIILANILLWGWIIYHIRKAYTKALHHSISKGVFNGEDVMIFNQHTINVLLQRAREGSLSERIYALKLLESAKHPQLKKLLEAILFEKDPDLRRYAFQRLEANGHLTIELLQKMSLEDHDLVLKEMIVTALCRLDLSYLHSFADGLSALSPGLKKEIILLLVKQKEFKLFYKGCSEIQRLLQSENPEDRGLVLDVISEMHQIEFTEAIELLMNDVNISVKKSALTAACKLRNRRLLPSILQKLEGTDKFIAMQGLFQYGDVLFEDIRHINKDLVRRSRQELIKIAGKVKGPHAIYFLLNLLKEEGVPKDKVVHVLWTKNYQAETVQDIFQFQELQNEVLANGIKKTALHHSVPSLKDRELIKRSIENEIWNDMTCALKISVIMNGKKEINRIIELADNKDRHKLYNGMEILELMLPKKTAGDINELLDYVLDPVAPKRLPVKEEEQNFFRQVVTQDNLPLNQWTRSICLYSSWQNHQYSFLNELKQMKPVYDNALFEETKTYVLNNLPEPTYDHY